MWIKYIIFVVNFTLLKIVLNTSLILKNYLISSMSQERLNGIATLCIEKVRIELLM